MTNVWHHKTMIEDVGEAFERERPQRPDESDRIVNEKKDEALEKKYQEKKK